MKKETQILKLSNMQLEAKMQETKISYVNIYNENKEYLKSFDMLEAKMKKQE
jgi:hypothetical protein